MIDVSELVRFFAAFAVIGIVLFAFTLVSRSGGRVAAFLRRDRSRIVQVIETTPLPHASSLHVVKVGDAYFVIGRTAHAISLLSEVSKELIERREVETALPAARLLPSSFRSRLL